MKNNKVRIYHVTERALVVAHDQQSYPTLLLLSTTMSLNNRKQERDFTAEVKELTPEVEKIASVS
jgi:hypothetical protein